MSDQERSDEKDENYKNQERQEQSIPSENRSESTEVVPESEVEETDDFELLNSVEEPEDISLPSLESRVVYIVQEDHYGRQGFNCSIDAVADPRLQFQAYLQALYNRKQAELDSVEVARDLDYKRISEKIAHNEQQIEEAKSEIREYRENVETLEKEHHLVKERLETKKGDLQTEHSNLAKEEKNLITTRVDAAKTELESIKNGLSPFLEDKRNEADRHDIKTLKVLYNHAAEKLEKLQEKLVAFSSSGMNSWTLGFMRTAGYAGIFAAGWFFTIYAMFVNGGGQNGTSQFMYDSQDYVGQAIKRLFSINNGATTNDKIISFLVGIGLFALFLVLVTLISTYTNSLIQKLMQRRVRSRISASSKQGNLSFNASVDAQNFHSFWLQVLPVVFIVGIVLLILSVWGLDNSTNIENAGKYAASLTFGISIALVFAGFLTIYIAKVIEPRIEKAAESESKEKPSTLWLNWEIVVSIILFLVSSLLLLLVGQNSQQWMATLILMEFISLMLVSGFAIGYAMRYSGIIFLDRIFKDRLERIAIQLEALQNPSYLNRYTEEGQNFKKRVYELQSQLLDLVKRKNARAIRVINEDSVQIEREKNSQKIEATLANRVRGWFNGIRGKKRQEEPQQEGKPLDIKADSHELSNDTVEVLGAATLKYFSSYRKIILDLEAEVKGLTAQETDLRMELTSIRKRRSHFEIDRLNSIRRWEQAIQDLKKYWINQQPKYTEVKEEIEFRYSRYEYQLRDGFMLGVWGRENGLGPTHTFYPRIDL